MEEVMWAINEFREVKLTDIRLEKRLIGIATQRMKQAHASIPESCGNWAKTKAAYRFWDNEDVKAETLQEGHIQATIKRIKGETGVVLAVQDTTELNYTAHPATTGLGYLEDKEHQGLYLQSTLIVTLRKVPLGLIEQQVWVRSLEEFGKKKERKQRPIEEKESNKWLKSLAACAKIQSQLEGVRIVNVGDSEADVYELFQKAAELKQELLVRACQDRCLEEEEDKLREHLHNQALAGEIEVEVKRQPERQARTARLEVRFAKVKLRPPERTGQSKLSPIEIWAVLAHEPFAPAGEDPLDWLLLTTVPVTNFTEACERVQWYTCRWIVEMYHKVLKSGCLVEKRQFSDYDNVRRYLAIDAVVAWQILYLTLLGREMPDMPCTTIFATHEWQALYCFHHKTKAPPKSPPTLQQVTGWIAKLGGFLGRNHDGNPGTKVLWIGLQRFWDISNAWLIFHSS